MVNQLEQFFEGSYFVYCGLIQPGKDRYAEAMYRDDSLQNPFVAFLSDYISLSAPEIALIESLTSTKSFEKGRLLLSQGDTCRNMYLVTSGTARVYIETPDQREFTLGFYFSANHAKLYNRFAGDFGSFLQQSPSRLYCEVLSDLETVQVSYDALQTLYRADPKFITVGKQIAEAVFILTENRLVAQKLLTAEERYRSLLETEPDLLNLFPHYYIATYLGITPQSLSRLRAKVTP